MSATPAWRRYLRFWRADPAADVDDELRFHFEERVEDLVARGVAPDAARAQAAEEFGDVERVRVTLREIGERRQRSHLRSERWRLVAQELRLALRRLARQPGFTVPVVLTLALGLGATLAVYTVVQRVVLDPLPYARADRLVRLTSPVPGVAPDAEWGLASGQYHHYLREARTLHSMALYRAGGQVTVGDDEGTIAAERTGVATVSASLQTVLDVAPVLGRAMLPEDNLAERPEAVWLTFGLWQRMFGGDTSVVGRPIRVHGQTMTVAGIYGPDVRLPEELQRPDLVIGLWLPLHLDPSQVGTSHTHQAIARLRDDVSLEVARAEIEQLTARLTEAIPDHYTSGFFERFGFSSRVTALRESVLGGIGRMMWILFAAVALVFVVACANVANLVLARSEARRQEIAVRAALGAGRSQLARHFLLESGGFTIVAGALAVALATITLALLRAAAPAGVPRIGAIAVDGRTLGIAAALVAATAIVFGLLPLARRGGAAAHTVEAGRGLTASRREQVARGALVTAQIAISVVLLTGGALLQRSYHELRSVEPGFEPEGVLSFRVVVPAAGYDDAQLAALYESLATRLASLPGVSSAGASTMLPLTPGWGCSGVIVPDGVGEQGACIPFVIVTPGYFETLGIPVAGESFTWSHVRGAEPVALLSGAAARRFWPGERALDRTVYASQMEEPRRVVGVAGDIRMDGLEHPPLEAVYLALLPTARSAAGGVPYSVTFVVRSPQQDATRLLPAVRAIVRELDPTIAIADVQPLTAVIARSMARVTFSARLLAAASVVAVLLSALGIYSVIGYVVTRRRAEMGIRIALGAQRAEVARLVVVQSLRWALAGIALGMVGAFATTRVLGTLLYGVSPTDPATLTAVALLLVVLAAVASWIPAVRAMRVSPVEALR